MDTCVQETVLFVNNGSLPVQVSWTPEVEAVDGPAAVWVAPVSFVVADRVRVHVRVEPKRGGRVRETLRFRSANADGDVGDAVVYVRGTVEQTPEVHFRPAAVEALDPTCAGTPESYDVEFRVANPSGPFDVLRRLHEFDAAGTLIARGAAKAYGPYGSGSDAVWATLNFRTPIDTEVSAKIERTGEITQRRN